MPVITPDVSPDHTAAIIAAVGGLLGPIAIVITTVLNRRHGSRKDGERRSEYSELRLSIEQGQQRTDRKIEHLRDTITLRVDEVEARAENAQLDATKALHVSIGVDGENGTRGELRKIESRVERIEDRERDRPMSHLAPTDVGSLTNRRTG